MDDDRSQRFSWRGRDVHWERHGSGPAVVFCHGTPWSSRLWRPCAEALAPYFTTYLWDMPGYGQSSKRSEHSVSLDLQTELFVDLLDYWDLDAPHIVTHDYGGVVSLRGLLLHGAVFSSLALVDVVALAPWGTDFFRLVRNHVDVLRALPPHIHEGALRSYVAGASHRGIGPDDLEALIAPWRGAEGQAAFYRQIAQADQVFTDEVEHRYPEVELPVLIVWGQEDAWLPVDMAYRLHDSIPGSELRIIREAGHLIQIDQPTALAAALTAWLTSQ